MTRVKQVCAIAFAMVALGLTPALAQTTTTTPLPPAGSTAPSQQVTKAQDQLTKSGYTQIDLTDVGGQVNGTAMKAGKLYKVTVSPTGEIKESPL